MIAAVHVDGRLTVVAAVLVAAGLVAYWIRLGRGDVPASRRRVRRITTAIMILTLPNLVRGLSFTDPAVHKGQYVVSWTLTMVVVFALFAAALVDGLVSVRLHRQATEKELRRAASELADALARRRGQEPAEPAPPARNDAPAARDETG